MPPAPPPPPSSLSDPKAKRGGHGCLIVFLVFTALALACGFGAYFLLGGRTMVALVEDALEINRRAEQSAGTRELRELGCQKASAMDLGEYVRVAVKHFPQDAGVELPEGPLEFVVSCEVASAKGAPSCEQVAATYVRALGGTAPSTFTASVEATDTGEDLCEARFDAHAGRLDAAPGATAEAQPDADLPDPP